MGKNAHINKIANSRRNKGRRFYAHGIDIVIPNIDTGEHMKLRFAGAFDHRKLRNMLRKTLVGKLTTEQLDWVIDNYGTRLRPMSKTEMDDALAALQEECGDE